MSDGLQNQISMEKERALVPSLARTEWLVTAGENGFVVHESVPGYMGGHIVRKTWIASSPTDLGRLMEELAGAAETERTGSIP